MEAEPVEGPWDLPDGWRWLKLGSVVDILDYIRRPINGDERAERVAGKASAELFPYFGATGRTGWIDDYHLEGDHILLGEDGAPFLDRGASKAYAVSGKFWVNNHAHILKGNGKVAHRYLLHALNALDYAPFVNGTTRLKLTQAAMRDLPLPVPEPAVQSALAGRIDALFAEIDAGEAALARARAGVETYRKALLKAAVTGELTADWRAEQAASGRPQESGEQLLARILADRRARWRADPKNARKTYAEPAGPDTEGLPELPQGWVWASLQQVAFISGGATVDKKRRPADPVEVPYLRVANVQRGSLDLSVIKTIQLDRDKLPDFLLKVGDILLNEGGDRDKVGRGWVWEGRVETCVHQNHVFKARPVSDLIEPRLVSMYLNELGRKFFLDESKQTTNLASISLTKVSRAPVAVPPAQEASAILARLDAMSDNEIGVSVLADLDDRASTLRQSILAAAFRGELAA